MWIIHWLSLLSVLHCEIRISNKYCNFFNPINTENILRLISTIKIITLFFCFTTAKLNTVLNYAAFIPSLLKKKPYHFNKSSNICMRAKNTAHASVAHCLFAKFFFKSLHISIITSGGLRWHQSILKPNIFSKKTNSTHRIDKVTNLPKLSWIYYTSAFFWIFRCRLTQICPYCTIYDWGWNIYLRKLTD